MTRRSIALVFALFIVAVGPVSAHDDGGGTPDVTIIVRNGLSHRDVRVEAGGIVRFVDRDDQRHRFRSRNGEGFDTGNIEPGEFAQVRLSSVGTYAYIDERDDANSSYHGRIVVGRAGPNGSGDATPRSTDGAPTKRATVTIGDRVFLPSTTTIAAGGTVTFRNGDSDEHTATGGIIDSGTLGPGASYTQTFKQPGTYEFLCDFHPEMQGSIEVVGAVKAEPTATPAPTAAPSPTDAPDDEVTPIEIVDLAFRPPTLEISAGTTVRWTNTGVAQHTVTSDDGSFDSGPLDSGATFERTFTTAGVVTYVCQIHPEMRGKVEVRGSAAAPVETAGAPMETAGAPTDVADPPAQTGDPPTQTADAGLASADLGSLGGIALAITLVSIASALFARLLRGTVRP